MLNVDTSVVLPPKISISTPFIGIATEGGLLLNRLSAMNIEVHFVAARVL